MRAMRWLVGVAMGCGMMAGTASAQSSRALFNLADDYRDSVSELEDHARQVRTVDRFTLRVIDDLEDAASDLRSAARRPENFDRLISAVNEVQVLQQRVEATLFASRCPIIAAELGPHWSESQYRFALLNQAISRVVGVGIGGCGIGAPALGTPGYSSGRLPVVDPRFGGRVPIPLPTYHDRFDGRGAANIPVVPAFPQGFPQRRSGDIGSAILSSLLLRALN